ncbi:hypothetical protein ACPV5L_20200, partial [Vibrio astriarenae]
NRKIKCGVLIGEGKPLPEECQNDYVIDHSNNDYNSLELKFGVNGVIGSEAKRNPLDFTTFSLNGFYKAWRSNLYTYQAGGFVSYETDQKNDNAQTVYGANISYQRWESPESANNYLFISLGYGEVDPSKNENRVNLLNGDKSKHERLDGEVVVQYAPGVNEISKIEVSYRHFYEPSAPNEIKQAGLDSFGLITAGVYFPKGWYVAFTDGKLPFSEQDDQVYHLGWSHNLF